MLIFSVSRLARIIDLSIACARVGAFGVKMSRKVVLITPALSCVITAALFNTLFLRVEFGIRPAEQIVPADKTGSQQLVYPPNERPTRAEVGLLRLPEKFASSIRASAASERSGDGSGHMRSFGRGAE